jgi:hypothetical protein
MQTEPQALPLPARALSKGAAKEGDMTKHMQSRARSHIAQAKLFGWKERHLLIDYVVAALESEGYDADLASQAAEVVWTEMTK